MLDSSTYLPRSSSQFQFRYALREKYRYCLPSFAKYTSGSMYGM